MVAIMVAFSKRVITHSSTALVVADAQRMAIQTSFAKKVTWSQDCNDGFLALLGNDGELDLALLDVKNRVRDLSLRKNNLILPIFGYRFSVAHFGEKYFGIKRDFNSLPHKGSPFSFSQGRPFPPTKAGRGGGTIANSNDKMDAYHAASNEIGLRASVSAARCARSPLRPCPFNFF